MDYEVNMGERIRHERLARGWSLDALASKMTSRGCAIQKTGIQKMEKVTDGKRRGISMNEALTLARIFEISVEELAVPPTVSTSHQARRLWAEHDKTYRRYLTAYEELVSVRTRLVELLESEHGEQAVAALAATFPDLVEMPELADRIDAIETAEDRSRAVIDKELAMRKGRKR